MSASSQDMTLYIRVLIMQTLLRGRAALKAQSIALVDSKFTEQSQRTGTTVVWMELETNFRHLWRLYSNVEWENRLEGACGYCLELWLKLEVIFLRKHVQNVRFQLLKCKYFLVFWLLHDSKHINLWVVDKTRHSRASAWSFGNTYAPCTNTSSIKKWFSKTGEKELNWSLQMNWNTNNDPKWVQIPATRSYYLANVPRGVEAATAED